MNSKKSVALAGAKRFLVAVGAIVAACASGPLLSAPIVANGSFEDPALSSTTDYSTITSGLTGWTIGGTGNGSIDLIRNYWAAQSGAQSVDLNGYNTLGTLSQSVGLTGGQAYQLSFWLSGNPDDQPTIKTMDVTVASLLSTSVSFDKSSATRSAMNWTLKSFDFTPSTDGSYLLTFASTSSYAGGNHWGPALDNVSIAAVPEPETWAMMLAGLSFLGWMSRRRREPGSVAAA